MSQVITARTLALITAIALGSGGSALVHDADAARRPSVVNALKAVGADSTAEGEIEEDVDEAPVQGQVACCTAGAQEQGCSDTTEAVCIAMGGMSLGAGSTCDGKEGGQDPCGNFQGCTDEPGAGTAALRGRLTVKVWGLTPKTKFTIALGGVKIGDIRTNTSGKSRRRFSARRLAINPRGRQIVVSNVLGAPALVGVISDPGTPCGVSCCLDSVEKQCADLTADACTAAGGAVTGKGGCNNDPCSAGGAFLK